MNDVMFYKVTFMRQIILFVLLMLLVPRLALNAGQVAPEALTEMYLKEKRLDGAAVELFMALREKYGKRLRTAGALIFCGEPKIAEEIQPSILDMILDADEILNKMDLIQYGIKELERKERMDLIRRAITGTLVYMFSADENGQFFTSLVPEHKDTYCKFILNAADEIQSEQK